MMLNEAFENIGSLVLGRKEGEAIQIGDDVVVELVRIQPSKAVLRIRAPKSMLVLRTELLANPTPGECVCGVPPEIPPVCEDCAHEIGVG